MKALAKRITIFRNIRHSRLLSMTVLLGSIAAAIAFAMPSPPNPAAAQGPTITPTLTITPTPTPTAGPSPTPTPAADLSVSINYKKTGHTGTVTLRVKNKANRLTTGVAQNVHLYAVMFPLDVAFAENSLQTGAAQCTYELSDALDLNCTLPDLARGDSVDISFDVDASNITAATTSEVGTTVSSSTFDPDRSNNDDAAAKTFKP